MANVLDTEIVVMRESSLCNGSCVGQRDCSNEGVFVA